MTARHMVAALGAALMLSAAAAEAADGILIAQKMTSASGTVTELTDASRQNFPHSIFAVPAGYTRRDMMGGRGRGRQ